MTDDFPRLRPITTPLARFSPETQAELGLDFDGEAARADRDRVLANHAERRKDALVVLNLRLETLARTRRSLGGRAVATADDVIRMLELWEDAPGPDRRWTGAVWRQGPWRKTGEYVPSLRRKCHGRPIPVWELDA